MCGDHCAANELGRPSEERGDCGGRRCGERGVRSRNNRARFRDEKTQQCSGVDEKQKHMMVLMLCRRKGEGLAAQNRARKLRRCPRSAWNCTCLGDDWDTNEKSERGSPITVIQDRSTKRVRAHVTQEGKLVFTCVGRIHQQLAMVDVGEQV